MSRSFLITTLIGKWCETLQTGPFTTGASLVLTTRWEVFLGAFYGPGGVEVICTKLLSE